MCPSSDAVTLYENPENNQRFYKCYSCGKAYRVDGLNVNQLDELSEEINRDQEEQTRTKDNVWFAFKNPYRGISTETLNAYGVETTKDDSVKFKFYDYEGHELAEKWRYPGKTFTIKHKVNQGFQKSGLFGQQLFSPGGKYVTVTSGEYDAMSVFELQGSRYACVSLKNGDGSVLTQEDKKWLDSFGTIIFCGDMDKPGRDAANRIASSFEKNKVKIVHLSQGKDANEYFQKIWDLNQAKKHVEAEELAQLLTREWWNAKAWAPEGLIEGKATLESFMEESESESIPYPWEGLQNMLHGIRTSEVIVLTAGSGVGKTAVVREMAHHIFKTVPEAKIGCMFLEESLKRTVKDFVGIELGVNLRLPENVVEPAERAQAWKNVFDNDRWIFWDHFGSNDVDTVCGQVRFIANNFGAKYIFLDHISIIVSDGSNGDERKTLDAIMTRLRTLVQELDVCLFLISHLRRSNDSVSHEEGGVTSLSQLRGSAGIGQLADIVIGLERNGQSDNAVERNLTTLRILKNRFTGETGPAAYLLWEKNSGRLKEIASYQDVEDLIAREEEEGYNSDLPQQEAA
jgi:twinkle protein